MQRGAPSFEQLRETASQEVDRVIRALPPPVRARVQDIPVVLDRRPNKALIEDGLDADLMGLFVGNAVNENEPAPVPLEILLFLDNIWDEAAGEWQAFKDEVRRTLLHEIGHYLGLDEEDLLDRDLD